jgi:hypothetical protein
MRVSYKSVHSRYVIVLAQIRSDDAEAGSKLYLKPYNSQKPLLYAESDFDEGKHKMRDEICALRTLYPTCIPQMTEYGFFISKCSFDENINIVREVDLVTMDEILDFEYHDNKGSNLIAYLLLFLIHYLAFSLIVNFYSYTESV